MRLKLNPLRSSISGRRVVVIDDSIVRGTTSRQLVRLLREAGAKEVHMFSSAPMFIAPCYFGTDIPSKRELIACNYTMEEMRRSSGRTVWDFCLRQLEKNYSGVSVRIL